MVEDKQTFNMKIRYCLNQLMMITSFLHAMNGIKHSPKFFKKTKLLSV
jgi:hypothetical protein